MFKSIFCARYSRGASMVVSTFNTSPPNSFVRGVFNNQGTIVLILGLDVYHLSRLEPRLEEKFALSFVTLPNLPVQALLDWVRIAFNKSII